MVEFPSSVDTNISLFNPFNRYKWTSSLKTAVSASATQLTLTDTSNIPTQVEGNYIGIDDEIMFVSTVNNMGTDKLLTVIRGQGDSESAEHVALAEVVQCHTAELHNRHNEAIIAIETYILNNTPAPLTINVTANPFTYSMASTAGYRYKLTLSVESSDNSSATVKSFIIIHWNVTGRIPQFYEGELITHGTEIDIQLANLAADMTNFDIVVTGANGGVMKGSVSEKVAI